jgi:hypothetical protein
MVRLFLGLLKGAVLGAALGFGAEQIGLEGGWGYLVYGLVGFVVGLLVGRPFWAHLADRGSTVWTSVLKGLVGFGAGAGLYAIAKAVHPAITIAGQTHALADWTYLFGALVGGVYGAWVEVDDAPPKPDDAKSK